MHKSNPDKRKKQLQTLKEVLQYIKQYRLFLVCSVLCAGISVALSLYNPILIGEAVDLVVGTGEVDFAGVFQILVKMGTLVGITAAAQWIMNLCNNKISYNVIRDMRQDAFKKIQILPFSYIDSHPYGQVVSKVIADVDQGSEQGDRRCGSVFRWFAYGIYTAVYWGPHDTWDASFYVFYQSGYHRSGGSADPSFSFGR